ncbi:RNA-binding domain-containing protein [Xylona heveae TC161]|uniref:RNA-binding domain-containing protein n=1 Tax=Xylona heveae (strain CBS 132557 / TC161) TaxID=1328760 RepID=A0A165IAR1_XYLHT|nr:RNA-binding domain-containing protein [Xylona heveae TC161]KZF24635.1 RNA-binding domain-containing protein [Xylona heveae TC161]
MATKVAPANAKPPGSKSSNPPNQTLYCTNLPDKLQKDDLRLSLYTLFSTYGPVLDVVALKTMKMRGQAHIVFRDIQASTQAMRALQGFNFYGKDMRIDYAKGKSDTIAKLDGTFKMPEVAAGASATSTTALQQSIFNAPPSAIAPPPNTAAAAAAAAAAPQPNGTQLDGEKSPAQGVKRRRDEESDEEEAPMDEEDDEGDVPMEASSDEE